MLRYTKGIMRFTSCLGKLIQSHLCIFIEQIAISIANTIKPMSLEHERIIALESCATVGQRGSNRVWEREKKDWKRDAIWLPDLNADIVCSQPHSQSWVGKHSSRCRWSYRLSLRQSTNASRPSPVNWVCVLTLLLFLLFFFFWSWALIRSPNAIAIKSHARHKQTSGVSQKSVPASS